MNAVDFKLYRSKEFLHLKSEGASENSRAGFHILKALICGFSVAYDRTSRRGNKIAVAFFRF